MTERDPAERRLWLMTLLRLGGLGLVLLAMWLMGRAPGDPAHMVGGLLLMAAGALVVLFAPRLFRGRP